jgi:hypothetical protein
MTDSGQSNSSEIDDRKKKRGPKPEVFKVPLPFEEAVKAALKTAPPKTKP